MIKVKYVVTESYNADSCVEMMEHRIDAAIKQVERRGEVVDISHNLSFNSNLGKHTYVAEIVYKVR